MKVTITPILGVAIGVELVSASETESLMDTVIVDLVILRFIFEW